MKFVKTALMALGMMLIAQGAASAQSPSATSVTKFDLAGVGAGLVILGAGLGIGKLAGSAVESIARQPEMASNIQTNMILAAALIEGATFFALIIILMKW